jgi:hypothetical protein
VDRQPPGVGAEGPVATGEAYTTKAGAMKGTKAVRKAAKKSELVDLVDSKE